MALKSPSLNVRTIQDVFQQSIKLFPDEVAFHRKKTDGYSTWTYADVGEMVRKASGSFAYLGIQKGDRVAILSENRPEWGMAYFTTVCSGAIAVPLDKQLAPFEIENLLNHAEVKYVVAPAGFTPTLLEVMRHVKGLKAIVSMEEEADRDGVISFRTLEAKGASAGRDYRSVEVSPDDVASIVYTSGTTGRPKGVMVTHGNLISQLLTLYPMSPCTPGDTFLSLLPMNHLYEFTPGFLGPFFCGARAVYLQSLLPARIVEAFNECKVTHLLGVPLLFTLLYESVGDRIQALPALSKWLFFKSLNISRAIRSSLKINTGKVIFRKIHEGFGGHLKQVICGGAALDPGYVSDILAAGFPLYIGYGLTETSPIVTYGDAEKIPLGSVGRPLKDVDVKIQNPDSEGVGQILVKGPNLMKGYYKDPEATAEAIQDGWFHTGDLGRIDTEGYLYICGRSKDMIVTHGGKKVFPEDLENYYGEAEDVKEICVVGIQKPGGQGEEPAALVVPFEPEERKPGMRKKTEAAIRERVKAMSAKLPDYKRLKKIVFRSKPLPKTTTMKVRRFMVRDTIVKGLERDTASKKD